MRALTGRPKTAICCVSEKIQTAYRRDTPRALDFFASLHLTILERPAHIEFFEQSVMGKKRAKPWVLSGVIGGWFGR
jgi:hypothetical protein